MATYSQELRRLRAEAGHPSARAFHRAAGGARTLGCTYKAYLDAEAGRSLPQPPLARRLAEALSVLSEAERARRYFTAYLRSLTGSEALTAFLERALSRRQGDSSDELFRKASDSSFAERLKPLTMAQAELLLGDFTVYWAFTWLSNEYRHWGVAALSRALSLPPAKLRAALAALVKAGLLAKDREGLYFCPDTGRVFTYPRDEFFVPRRSAALKSHWNAMAERRGRPLFFRALGLRAAESKLREHFLTLAQTVNGAHLYARREPGPDVCFVLIEARVRRLERF